MRVLIVDVEGVTVNSAHFADRAGLELDARGDIKDVDCVGAASARDALVSGCGQESSLSGYQGVARGGQRNCP